MVKSEVTTSAENNRELFFQAQSEIETRLARIAADVIGIANVCIREDTRSSRLREKTLDISIGYEPKDKSLVSSAFTYHRGRDSLTIPWVRLKQTREENGISYVTRNQLRPDENGLIVWERIAVNSVPGTKPIKLPEEIRPAMPETIIEMAKLAAYHTQSTQA